MTFIFSPPLLESPVISDWNSGKYRFNAANDSDVPVEARYQLLVEAVQDYAIFMLDDTGHVASWNSGARKIKGYTPEEIIGRHFPVFYTPGRRSRRQTGTRTRARYRPGPC
ncbi:PAS domain S-box protein [Paraburkholderia strydomiana]